MLLRPARERSFQRDSVRLGYRPGVQRMWTACQCAGVVTEWAEVASVGNPLCPLTPSGSYWAWVGPGPRLPPYFGRPLSPPGAMSTDLVIIGTVSGLLHGCVLLVIAHLHAHHRVHVQAHQLPSFDHCDADLQAGDRGPERKLCEPWSGSCQDRGPSIRLEGAGSQH